MKIVNHLLVHDDDTPVRFQRSPNVGKETISPKYLIVHYTEGSTLEGAVITLAAKENKVSSHVVIGRDGTVVQLVPFNTVAWHAGVSAWKGLKDLNQYTFGIELDNAGMLLLKDGLWRAPFGWTYPFEDVLGTDKLIGKNRIGWLKYPQVQLDALKEVSAALVKEYSLEEILGHSDISAKRDPGPAFPMDEFRKEVMCLAGQTPPGTITPAPPEITVPAQPQAPVKETPNPVVVIPPATPTVPSDIETPLACRIPVVEYHDTEYKQGPTVVMRTEWFLTQFQWLYDHGYKTLTGDQLVRYVHGDFQPAQKSFAIRFDLGAPIYKDFNDVIIPALRQFSFRAFFFVLVSMTRESNQDGCVCWDNLIEWEKAGLIEVASHGMYHPDYQKITSAQRLWDLRESKKTIEAKLGHPILFFGFPMDSAPEHPEAFLQAAGYSLGFAGPRMERSVLFKDRDAYALPCYYPYSDPRYYPAINGMKGLDFGEMIEYATRLK